MTTQLIKDTIISTETVSTVELLKVEIETNVPEVGEESVKKIIDDYRKLKVICDIADFRADSDEEIISGHEISSIFFKKSKVSTDILNPERKLRSIVDLLEYIFDLLSQKDDFKTITDMSDFSSYSPLSVKAMLAELFTEMDYNTPYYFKYGKYLVFALRSEALGNFVYHTPISEVRKIRKGSRVLNLMS